MTTAAQASELWCPMVRIGVTQNYGGPSAINDPTTQYRGGCIADKCAMWRWLPMVDPNWVRPTHPPASFQTAPTVLSDHGFCGLAGRPEFLL